MKLLITLALFAGIAGAQSNTTPITGVWKIVEASQPQKVEAVGVRGHMTGQQFLRDTQGGIYIFTGKYFSKLWTEVQIGERN